jgi:uncharacterized membrane protein YtjA (UPF0391 family)
MDMHFGGVVRSMVGQTSSSCCSWRVGTTNPSAHQRDCMVGSATISREGMHKGSRARELWERWRYWGKKQMLQWAVVFLVIALVAAVFGFGGIASAAAGIAKFLFFLFVVIFVVLLVLGLIGARRVA